MKIKFLKILFVFIKMWVLDICGIEVLNFFKLYYK